MLQQKYLVTASDRGQTVCDQNDRLCSGKVVDRFHDGALGNVVERARALVHDEEIWIAIESASDTDTLALTTREPDAALTKQRVVALLQFVTDEIVEIGMRAACSTAAMSMLRGATPNAMFAATVSSAMKDMLGHIANGILPGAAVGSR